MTGTDKLLRIAQEVTRLQPVAASFRGAVACAAKHAEAKQREEHEVRSDGAGARDADRRIPMDAEGAEQPREGESRWVEGEDKREVKRWLTSKTSMARLVHRAANPELKKLKSGGLVATMKVFTCMLLTQQMSRTWTTTSRWQADATSGGHPEEQEHRDQQV